MNTEKLIEELRKVYEYYFCSTVVHPSGLNVRMMAKNCADKLEEMKDELAKAKRRAEKAVADLKYIAVCETCKKSGVTEYPESAVIQCEYYDSECGCGKYEWRGDAEEGDGE